MTDSWHSSACILCENNCGIKVQLGGQEGREQLLIISLPSGKKMFY